MSDYWFSHPGFDDLLRPCSRTIGLVCWMHLVLLVQIFRDCGHHSRWSMDWCGHQLPQDGMTVLPLCQLSPIIVFIYYLLHVEFYWNPFFIFFYIFIHIKIRRNEKYETRGFVSKLENLKKKIPRKDNLYLFLRKEALFCVHGKGEIIFTHAFINIKKKTYKTLLVGSRTWGRKRKCCGCFFGAF